MIKPNGLDFLFTNNGEILWEIHWLQNQVGSDQLKTLISSSFLLSKFEVLNRCFTVTDWSCHSRYLWRQSSSEMWGPSADGESNASWPTSSEISQYGSTVVETPLERYQKWAKINVTRQNLQNRISFTSQQVILLNELISKNELLELFKIWDK